ncbi:MAG: hypothetical protein R6T89_05175 [Candidatus Syntrophosphaera sp.]
MGRALIILVLLMSTLFVAVAVRVQRDMAKLPDTLLEEQLQKEAEDVSDYVLRYAVLYAKKNIFAKQIWKDVWEPRVQHYGQNLRIILDFGDNIDFPISIPGIYEFNLPPFRVHNSQLGSDVTVKTIEFNHVGENSKEMSFRAESMVDASLQGTALNDFPAEIAFDYALLVKPNCFYFESEQPQINSGHDDTVYDTSGSNNHGFATKGLATSPANFAWKSLYFPGPGGINDNGAFYVPDNATNTSMQVSEQFTLVLFAQVDEYHKNKDGALVWLPSSAPPPYEIPSIGIWYDYGSGNMNFELGIDMDSEPVQSYTIPYAYADYLVPKSLTSGQNAYPLTFLALTFGPRASDGYSQATIYFKSFYIDNQGEFIPLEEYSGEMHFIEDSFSQNTADDFEDVVKVVKTANGASIGGRITDINGEPGNAFDGSVYDRYLKGLMDNIGMYDRELTADEIDDFFWNVVYSTSITYLRD